MITSPIVRLLLASYSDRCERSKWEIQHRIGIMKFGSISSKTVLLLAALAVGIVGEQGTTIALADTAAPVGPKLTPKLKQLLKTEMTEITMSTSEITKAITTADHATVEKEAINIAKGFILKRLLTDQDKKDLKRAAPASFLKLDAIFHQTAAKLAHAAKRKDSELEGFYLSKMLGYCVSCHSTYVPNKLGGFVK